MKLYNPFKWHVIISPSGNFLNLRKYSFKWGRWVYWDGGGIVTTITLAKDFRDASSLKRYINDHYCFSPKRKEKSKFFYLFG